MVGGLMQRMDLATFFAVPLPQVTQLYLHWTDSSVPAPVRQLVGVARTHIAAGQSATVRVLGNCHFRKKFTNGVESAF